ncbi:hypothetical protein ACFL6I_25020 [candidate division KSB1 bacterium]
MSAYKAQLIQDDQDQFRTDFKESGYDQLTQFLGGLAIMILALSPAFV